MDTYGYCQDPNCEYEQELVALIQGVCEACHEDQQEADAFNRMNEFEQEREDYGQVPYGECYN